MTCLSCIGNRINLSFLLKIEDLNCVHYVEAVCRASKVRYRNVKLRYKRQHDNGPLLAFLGVLLRGHQRHCDLSCCFLRVKEFGQNIFDLNRQKSSDDPRGYRYPRRRRINVLSPLSRAQLVLDLGNGLRRFQEVLDCCCLWAS